MSTPTAKTKTRKFFQLAGHYRDMVLAGFFLAILSKLAVDIYVEFYFTRDVTKTFVLALFLAVLAITALLLVFRFWRAFVPFARWFIDNT